MEFGRVIHIANYDNRIILYNNSLKTNKKSNINISEVINNTKKIEFKKNTISNYFKNFFVWRYDTITIFW